MTGLPCGDSADARYCETFWAQNAEIERLTTALQAAERVAGHHERALYAAWIDVRHGDPGDADEILAEQLDGFDGPQWNGAETGIEWLERTREAASGTEEAGG